MSVELIVQLNNILKADSRSPVSAKPGSATVTTEIIRTRAEVIERLKGFGDCSGWITITDEVVPLTTAKIVDETVLTGRNLLSAELVSGNISLHLRQAPDGWLLTTIEATKSVDMIKFLESFESKLKGRPKLQYETYWRLDSDAAGIESYQPWVSRFIGFEKGGDNE